MTKNAKLCTNNGNRDVRQKPDTDTEHTFGINLVWFEWSLANNYTSLKLHLARSFE